MRDHSAPATLEAADLLVKATAIAFADCPVDLADQAYQELLRALEVRERVLSGVVAPG